MKLDRQAVLRTDFPTNRRGGYDTAAVNAHLEAIAAALPEHGTEPTLASNISDHVQSIVAAAETAAAQIEREAREHAQRTSEHVAERAQHDADEVAGAARTMLRHIGEVERELDELFATLRARGEAISAAIAELDTAVEEQFAAAETTTEEPAPPAPVQAPQQPAAAAETPADEQAVQAARLVALDMALSGKGRVEIDEHLAQNFTLPDRSRLVDEVLAAAE